MLIATPANLISREYTVREGSQQIAQINLPWFWEPGKLEIEGRSFDVGREGFMTGPFFLAREGDRLLEAEKLSMLARRFIVTAGKRTFSLEAAAPIARRFLLIEAGQVIGEVRPNGFLSQTVLIDLPEELPLEVRLFMTWLVLVLWKRAQRAAS